MALLDACEQLLLELPVEDVTLPAVARRAGVTKPTAYSHFPDNDALMAAFLLHLRDRVGMDDATLARTPPAQLPDAVRNNYAKYERNERLMLRVMESPSYNRVRLARKVDRHALTLPMWRELGRERELRERLGPIYLLVSPPTWRWLRESWGLSADEASRAAAWAMEALVEAVGNTPNGERRTKPRTKKTTKKEKRR